MQILIILGGILLAFWILSVLIRKGVKLFIILFIIALILLGYFGIDFLRQNAQISWAFWR